MKMRIDFDVLQFKRFNASITLTVGRHIFDFPFQQRDRKMKNNKSFADKQQDGSEPISIHLTETKQLTVICILKQ